MQLTLGSLFDGSGGFPLAGALCGITPLWASEIEPYPIAVTKSRFPQMKHLGDISKVNGAEIEPVDIISFGSPCQDLSVAGKRAGLKHEANGDQETTRSGLFMEAIRIIKEMRRATNGKHPRFALWENVPGAFSSNKGEDFRIVLEELIKVAEAKATVPPAPKGGWPYADAYVGDGWSLAYRTFDAQYWGVPQRRRRIYLVADFAGGCAPGILFEREGLRGYFAEGKSPWKRTAGGAQGGIGTDGCENKTNAINVCVTLADVASTLRAGADAPKHSQDYIGRLVLNPVDTAKVGEVYISKGADICDDLQATSAGESASKARTGVLCVGTQQGGAEITQNGICPTITAAAGMSGNNQPWICADNFKVEQGKCALNVAVGVDGYNGTLTGGRASTLGVNCGMSTGRNGVLEQSEIKKHCETPVVFCMASGQAHAGIFGSKCPTLSCTAEQPIVTELAAVKEEAVILFEPRSQDGVPRIHKDVSPTLNTAQGGQRQPCVAVSVRQYPYCKSSRPSFKGDSETYIDCKVSNTLNTFDLGDKRANELIVETVPVYCVQGNCIDRAETAGCNGKGWREDASFTLNTIDRPAVAYAVDQGGGKSGANCYINLSPTIACTHGGEPTIACAMTTESFMQVNKGASPTLAARDYKGAPLVCFGDDAQIYRQNSYAGYAEGIGGTLKTSGGSYGGGSESLIVEERSLPDEIRRFVAENNSAATHQQDLLQLEDGVSRTLAPGTHASGSHLTKTVMQKGTNYIVRRLTPTECARLQGFADGWGFLEHKDSLTDEEYKFWLDVRNTHAVVNGRKEKEYTKAQILSWYNRLHSDSSEYKMWGNGVALPPTLYCMQGISDALLGALCGGEDASYFAV